MFIEPDIGCVVMCHHQRVDFCDHFHSIGRQNDVVGGRDKYGGRYRGRDRDSDKDRVRGRGRGRDQDRKG